MARPNFKNVKNLYIIDATDIALKILGAPIVNTVMLGAAVGVTGMVSIVAIEGAVDGMMAPNLREKNKKAIRCAYDLMKGAK